MKRHPIISFIAGFIISGLVLATLYAIFLFLTFDLGGGETIQQIEDQRTILLIGTIIISIISVFVVRQFIRKKRKYTAYGTGILPVFALILVIVFYMSNLTRSTPFDKAKWEQTKMKPFDIAVTLVKEKKLIGINKTEIIEMLGSGQEHGNMADRSYIKYYVEKDWTLTVCFDKDKVIQATLNRPMLCV